MQRGPAILLLEPFVLLATAMAALLLLLTAWSRRLRRQPVRRELLVLQCCAAPCIAVAVLMPSLGPAALLCFFGLSLVTISRMQGPP